LAFHAGIVYFPLFLNRQAALADYTTPRRSIGRASLVWRGNDTFIAFLDIALEKELPGVSAGEHHTIHGVA
jgi:hypothetical protein